MPGKKILLTTSHNRIGSGGSMQLYLLAREMVNAGAFVTALFAANTGEDMKASGLSMLEDLGVRVMRFQPSRWYSPLEILSMRRLLKSERFDIVHTHKGGDLSLVLLALAGLRLPALVNTRGVNFPLGANRFKYNLSKLDRIIVVSEDSRKVMMSYGVRGGKIRVVYGGVDTERFTPRSERREAVRRALGLPEDAVVALMAANLVRQKGHADYLRAAGILRAKHPEAIHLFAGNGGSAELDAVAQRLGIADRVRFLGFRRDVEDLFAASDFSVIASFAGEGVSGVLRESMACGVPVITTDVGGNAELVKDGESGLVVPKNDPDALAAAMARLIEDRGLYTQLREEGRRIVVENFSASGRAKNIFRIYEEIFHEKEIPF